MSDPLFFIDKNPEDEENIEKVPSTEESTTVLGQEDFINAEKRRKKKEKERNLSKFLFGGVSPDEGVDVSRDLPDSSPAVSEDDESDLDDEDLDSDAQADPDAGDDEEDDAVAVVTDDDDDDDAEVHDVDPKADDNDSVNSDEEEGLSDEEDDEDGSDSDSDGDRNAQDLLPDDLYANNLNSRRGKKRKAAWKDEGDEQVLVKDVAANYKKAPGKHGTDDTSTEAYGRAVERRFKNLVGEPSWAKLDRPDDDHDSDDEFFRETTDLLDKGKGSSLTKDYLDYRKLRDMNYSTHNEGAVIRSTEFHPTSTVGLVTGLNGAASLFQIDGNENPKIQTINFKDFPVKTGHFSVDGNEVIVGSQHHSHIYIYDMIAGKIIKTQLGKKMGEFNTQKFEVSPDGKIIAFKGRFGAIHLISARTKEFVGSLKMNDECQALTFSRSGGQLFTHGDGGEVYVWDVRSRTCTNKFVDDGCIAGSALAVNSNYLATGSSEGVVNVYNLNNINKTNPTPDKVILNLTTQINQLSFNPTGEILAMSSELRDSAVKLVHFPSKTVFSNFPTTKNIFRINSVSFSPAGGYLSLGNNKGAALLYRINQYKDY